MPRLLIVDDEPAITFAVSEYLGIRGYQVDRAVGVAEAEDLLRRVGYAIVITDLSLGGREGREGLALAAAVRQRHPRTRTIILTAYGSRASEATARALGVDAFLHKPTRLSEIARLVDALLQQPAAEGDATAAGSAPRPD
jgi:DNA-binding response OmpR family regulator